MSNRTEYYELVKRQIEPLEPGEFRITTAAVWICALCRVVIDGMGGPGNGELCVRCGDDIKSGNFRVNPRES